jgi:glycosyltransferase involved in cell wall biosynthesis
MHKEVTAMNITVVAPTKNEAQNISRFLSSIPSGVPLVVADDSTDGTAELVSRLRPYNTQVIRATGGIARSRQAGAEAARTGWVLFTDADVVFPTGYFDRIGRYLQAGADGFYGPKLSAGGHEWFYRVFTVGQALCSRLSIPAGSGSNMAIRKEALSQVGGFNLRLPCNEDTDLLFRLARQGCRLLWAPDLPVLNTDHRRLRRGAFWRFLHIITRSFIIYLNLHLPLPHRWVYSSWGYWK